jgi:hypothetical protein
MNIIDSETGEEIDDDTLRGSAALTVECFTFDTRKGMN